MPCLPPEIAKLSDIQLIVAADWHLCEKPPIARSAEVDWYKAMERPIKEIKLLASHFRCPIAIAGDIFDKANASSELINWTIDKLEGNTFYAIPGNHDLPGHRVDDLVKSAFWTLVEAKRIICLLKPIDFPSFSLHGFPYGVEVKRYSGERHDFYSHIALVHSYIWCGKHGFKGATNDSEVSNWKRRLRGYKAAIFGDNHKGFVVRRNGVNICNCGSLMRRSSDQRNYKPFVGLVQGNGCITQYYLNCSKDKFFDVKRVATTQEDSPELAELLKELGTLGDSNCDFKENLIEYMRKKDTPKKVKSKVLTTLEGK